MSGLAGIKEKLYYTLLKRPSTFALVAVVGALVWDRTVDITADAIWEYNNQGKLWHHIKDKYEQPQ